MALRVKIPETAGMRRSVEVQHARRGFLLMLRRGLHGAKNWALELEEDGSHRPVWAKLFRVLVILAPLWVVLSAVTGGPQRGGHSAGVGQSLFMSLLILVIGLAVFSARERRMGREEPWAELEESTPEGTESNEGGNPVLVDPAPEAPIQSDENVQVTEPGSEDETETGEDISEDSIKTTRFESPELHEVSHQATSADPKIPMIPGSEAPTTVLSKIMQKATSGGTNPSKPDSSFEVIAGVATDFHEEPVREATPGLAYSLVKYAEPDVQTPAEETTSDWLDLDVSDITESDESLIGDEPTTPLRTPMQTASPESLSARESAQVSLEKAPVQQALQGVLQVQFAQTGPYPQGLDPVHGEWWVVAPDVEPQRVAGEPDGGISEVLTALIPKAGGEITPEIPGPMPVRRHLVVLTYLASQAPKSGFTGEEKERSRADAIEWLRDQTGSGHLNRAEAARMLGVDASTVTRWLNDDPWAG